MAREQIIQLHFSADIHLNKRLQKSECTCKTVFTASAAYTTATAPYMVGFTKAPYTMVTANRASITPASFNSLGWDGEMTDFINNKIKAPTSEGGENYNVSTANRRVSGDMIPGAGFVIGWGSWNFADSKVNNQAFGLVIVKNTVKQMGLPMSRWI